VSRLRNLDPRTDVLPFVLATVGEFAALFFWLHYLDQGRFILANAILWAGFALERGAVLVWIRYVYRDRAGGVGAGGGGPSSGSLLRTLAGVFVITLTEILIWILWVAIADGKIGWPTLSAGAAFGVAAVVLFVLMQVQHSVEMAGLKGNVVTAYLVDRTTLFFTFMEVAGAVGWLWLVRADQPVAGAICLLVGLSIEHVIQGSQLRPDDGR
jgi:hypothetical protein